MEDSKDEGTTTISKGKKRNIQVAVSNHVPLQYHKPEHVVNDGDINRDDEENYVSNNDDETIALLLSTKTKNSTPYVDHIVIPEGIGILEDGNDGSSNNYNCKEEEEKLVFSAVVVAPLSLNARDVNDDDNLNRN